MSLAIVSSTNQISGKVRIMNNEELEDTFQDEEVDLSLVQVNIETTYGTVTFYTPSAYTTDEFDTYVDGVFKGIALGIELMTGVSLKVIPASKTVEDVEGK